MANDKNKASDFQSAQDLLKKLSIQYSADTSKKDQNPNDTFEGIPVSQKADERMNTSEFMDIFDIPKADDESEEKGKNGFVIEMMDSKPLEIKPLTSTPETNIDSETQNVNETVAKTEKETEKEDKIPVEENGEQSLEAVPNQEDQPIAEANISNPNNNIENSDSLNSPEVNKTEAEATEDEQVHDIFDIPEQKEIAEPVENKDAEEIEESVLQPIQKNLTPEVANPEFDIDSNKEGNAAKNEEGNILKESFDSEEKLRRKNSIEERFKRDPDLTNEFAMSFDDMYEDTSFKPTTSTIVIEKEPQKPISIQQDNTKTIAEEDSKSREKIMPVLETSPIIPAEEAKSNKVLPEKNYDSFKPEKESNSTEESAANPNEKVYNLGSFEQTNEIEKEADTSETVMMKAFGLDTAKVDNKDDTHNIFDTYTFASTDEMEAPKIDDTSEIAADSTDDESENEMSTEDSKYQCEYTDPSQKQEILKGFHDKYIASKAKMIISAVFAVLLVVVEALPAIFSDFNLFGNGNEIYQFAIDGAILLASAALVFSSMIKSVILMTRGKFNSDAILVFSFVFSLIITAVSILLCVEGIASISLYNLPFVVCVFFSSFAEFLGLRRDVYAFKVISSSEPKTVLNKLSRIERHPEEAVFGEYMGDSSNVYKNSSATFVSDFFRKKKELSPSTNILKILIPSAFVLAIAVGLISSLALGNSVYDGISHGVMTYWFCLPVCAFISFVYPQYTAAAIAYTNKSAIVGDTTPEECKKISVITFNDVDAFPPERIRFKSVKVFADYNIENVIYFVSSVFNKVGGPLASVFKQATLDSINSENVEIKEIHETGIDATVDGRHIVIGTPAFMETQLFETIPEDGDDEFIGQTNRRILYLACDEVVVGKFYIQYNVSSDFLYIVHHLCDEGICVSIRTSDPCIDNDVLYKNKIDPTELPVRVIKGEYSSDVEEKISCLNSAIVSTGTRKGLIKSLLVCDRLNKVRKANLVFKLLSVLIGLVVSVLLVIMQSATGISSLFPAVYDMFWILPLLLFSKIYL